MVTGPASCHVPIPSTETRKPVRPSVRYSTRSTASRRVYETTQDAPCSGIGQSSSERRHARQVAQAIEWIHATVKPLDERRSGPTITGNHEIRCLDPRVPIFEL